jgi:3'(2'), 5'-bisphosphate nucleotidase
MTEHVTPALLDAVVELSRFAGDKIMQVYGKDDFSVQTKGDQSPLTEADLAAHHAIVDALTELTPEIPILSEESADTITWAQRREWPAYWLVDPLDGTKEFIKRNGEFTVNMALVENHDTTMGVVHVPARGETYSAAVGVGVFKHSGQGSTAISVQAPAASPMRVAGSRSHGNEETRRFIQRLGETESIAIGSSLKLCLIAEGAVDVYPRFGPTSEWDTAAAQCVVEQAGGQVTTMDLQRLRYNTKEQILNPYFLVFGDGSVDWRQYMD